jgi:uncharacterized protein
MNGAISFFELGVGDVRKGRAFYGGLFDWGFETGPSGEDAGAAITTGGVPGGMHGGDAGASPSVFFAVGDLDAALERVVELGGTVLGAPGGDGEEDEASVARFGRFRWCTDDQGSGFGLHELPR